jgi:vacuolar protein sorting-associated protein IST1
MPLIQSLKLCPPDLQESVVTVIYAAARTEIPELMKVRKMFKAKYGDKFVERALMNENRIVNDRIVNKLGINPPNSFLVLQYMKEIAKAHNVQ